MKYPLEKYEYYTHKTKSGATEVIAVSTYAGKVVRGTAKCDPRDEYQEEKGKQLAAARCNARVAAKRRARAQGLFKKAEAELKAATRYYEKMKHYKEDAEVEYEDATKLVSAIEAEF